MKYTCATLTLMSFFLSTPSTYAFSPCEPYIQYVDDSFFPLALEGINYKYSFTYDLSGTFSIPPQHALNRAYRYTYDESKYENPFQLENVYENLYYAESDTFRAYRAASLPDGFEFAVNENISFKVSEDIPITKVVSAPSFVGPNLSFEERTGFWGQCNYDDTLSFAFEQKERNVEELGVMLLVHYGLTEEEALTGELLMWAKHVQYNQRVALDVEQYSRLRDPFCISIQTIDLTGQLSPSSQPLCIDPEDDDSPYVDNPNAGCACESTHSHVPVHPIYIVLSFILVWGRTRQIERQGGKK